MGEGGITARDLSAAVRAGRAIRRVLVVERADGYLCAFVRLAGEAVWRRIMRGYRAGPRQWVDYRRLSDALRNRFFYGGVRWVYLHDDPRLPRMGIVL